MPCIRSVRDDGQGNVTLLHSPSNMRTVAIDEEKKGGRVGNCHKWFRSQAFLTLTWLNRSVSPIWPTKENCHSGSICVMNNCTEEQCTGRTVFTK
jgi:hypothetical protein